MDDFVEIVQNPLVVGAWGPGDAATALLGDVYAGRGKAASGLYRPAATVAYRLIGGGAYEPGERPSPQRFHAVNILVHALVVLAGYGALRQVGFARGAATAASLLFAVHPIAVDVVAPASGLKDLLASGTGLGALAAWRKAGRAADARWLAVSCALLFVALLSKESAVAFPVVFLASELLGVLDGAPGGQSPHWTLLRRRGRAWGALAAIVAIVAILRVMATGGLYAAHSIPPIDNPLVEQGFLAARGSALKVAAHAARVVAFPVGFAHDASAESIPLAVSPHDPQALAGALLVAAGVAAAVVLSRRPGGRLAAFGLWSFFALWLVVSNLLVLFGSIFAPRLLALPLWGLCAAAASGGAALLRARSVLPRAAAVAAFAVLCVILAGVSAVRCRDWRDDATLNEAALRAAPRNAKALSNLAGVRLAQGRVDDAIALARRSIAVRPERTHPWQVLASALERQGRSGDALRELEGAVARAPRPSPGARVELARMLLEAGRGAEAAGQIERVLADPDRLRQDVGAALWLRGRMLRLAGRDREAAAVLDEADATFPGDARILHERGLARFSSTPEAALADLRAAVAASPRDPVLLYDAGVGHLQAGRPAEAAAFLASYLELDPHHREARLHFAGALAASGRKDAAAKVLRDWLLEAPADREAREALQALGG